MQLQALPRGNAQRAVGDSIGEVIMSKVGICRERPSWNARPYHHLIRLFHAGSLPALPRVAVLLLIDSMELQQGYCFLGKPRRIQSQLARQRTTQAVALRLNCLYLAALPRAKRQ